MSDCVCVSCVQLGNADEEEVITYTGRRGQQKPRLPQTAAVIAQYVYEYKQVPFKNAWLNAHITTAAAAVEVSLCPDFPFHDKKAPAAGLSLSLHGHKKGAYFEPGAGAGGGGFREGGTIQNTYTAVPLLLRVSCTRTYVRVLNHVVCVVVVSSSTDCGASAAASFWQQPNTKNPVCRPIGLPGPVFCRFPLSPSVRPSKG